MIVAYIIISAWILMVVVHAFYMYRKERHGYSYRRIKIRSTPASAYDGLEFNKFHMDEAAIWMPHEAYKPRNPKAKWMTHHGMIDLHGRNSSGLYKFFQPQYPVTDEYGSYDDKIDETFNRVWRSTNSKLRDEIRRKQKNDEPLP